MARLEINIADIKQNIIVLSDFFDQRKIKWSLITKVFSGDKEFLKRLLTPDIVKRIHSVGDSRLTSLKNLKEVDQNLTTIYIKPPAKTYVDDVVRYADISSNTSYETIVELNKAAKKQDKIHKVIIMIEMGELREGVNREELQEFYNRVFDLSNIEVIGLGSNLGCMFGVEPSYDKLLQLVLYKEIIELKHESNLELVSGGTSITLPMVEQGNIPPEINHFRIGEAAFFGMSPYRNERFLELKTNAFKFYCNIIELEQKKIVPDGVINEANIGHTADVDEEDETQMAFKAILDFGILDVDQEDLESTDSNLEFVGITSDMTVVSVGDNKDENGNPVYKVGQELMLKPNYLAVARLLNSRFIDKEFVG